MNAVLTLLVCISQILLSGVVFLFFCVFEYMRRHCFYQLPLLYMFSGEILMFLLFLFIVCVYQVNYGNFMHGLMKENIQLNRKVLSELSMHEPYSFKALVDISRNAFPGNKNVMIPPKKEGLSIVL
jgi:hypothetical protein